MELNEGTLLILAEAVADGSTVDWERAESSAEGADERHVVHQLRILADLAVAARVNAATWGPLHIRGEVGGGTFGTVYRAWDTRLEREVALKLLHGEHAAQQLASTVVKEGRLLAQIRHPNVVTVHGADVLEGKVGIWMEFVNGRTLKEIIQEQGPFGAHEAALIGRDLCRALAAVHKQGSLHRDVKAQNVMREAGGRTVLMDFGAGTANTAGDTTLRGTPVYLAPEVLAGGLPEVTSDLYSLGVLLFFLVTGEFPVVGASLDDFRARHARGTRRLLRDVRPDLPAAFVRVVDAATAPDAAERPASAGALEAMLETALGLRGEEAQVQAEGIRPSRPSKTRRPFWTAVGVAVGLVLATIAATGWEQWSSGRKSAVTVARNSVAILPFKNLSNDPENDYFSKGVADDIAAHLARLGSLRVISGTSVGRYADAGKSATEIGAELGVAAVMAGSVRRAGARIRIVSELLDSKTGEQLWSETFDRELTDIFQLQSEVSRKIAVALKGELSVADAAKLGIGRPQHFEAFNLYLKGRYYWSLRTEDGFQRSLQYYQQAIARDPLSAPAYAGMADTYSLMGVYGMMVQDDAVSRASAAAIKAIELDDTLAEAHASLGYIQKNKFEWQAAEKSLRRAIDLKPGYAQAHHWYSIYLSQHGRFSEAIAASKTAISLDPLAMSTNAQLGSVLLLARRYDEAIMQYEKVLVMDPTFASAHQIISEAYSYKGDYDRALASFQRAVKVRAVGREDQEQTADKGFALAMSGRRREARRVLMELLDRQRQNPKGVSANIATIYAALGDRVMAFTWLSRAVELRDAEIGYLKVDPRWDSLRADPRFDTLLARVGFN